MRIGRSTLIELGRLRVGEWPIPTLASLVALVAGRVPLLLEVKVDADLWRWVPALRRELAGYAGRFGVMSLDPRLPRLLKTNLPTVRRGLVMPDGLSSLRRRLYVWLAGPQFIAVERSAIERRWTSRLRGKRPLYSWTIRSAAERAKAEVHADALIWEADGRP